MKLLILTIISGLLLGLGACLPDPFRGSEVVLELGTQNAGDIANRSTQHYEAFAEINGGLVSIGQFTIDQTLEVQAFPSGEKLGVANRLSADGLPQSGIFFVTPINLADATELLISIETNGETDPSPNGTIVGRAPLNSGRRSMLVGLVTGSVPVITGGEVPLVDSRVAVVLNEDEAE